jgi:hypothetical protein
MSPYYKIVAVENGNEGRERRADRRADRAEKALEKGKKEKAEKLAAKSELLQATTIKRADTISGRKTARAKYSELVYRYYKKKEYKKAQANLIYATNNGASLGRVERDWDGKFKKGKERDKWEEFVKRGKNYCPAVNRRRNIAINALTITAVVGAVGLGVLTGGAAFAAAAAGSSVSTGLAVGGATAAVIGGASVAGIKGGQAAARGGSVRKTSIDVVEKAKRKSEAIEKGSEKHTSDVRKELEKKPTKKRPSKDGGGDDYFDDSGEEGVVEEEITFAEEDDSSTTLMIAGAGLLILGGAAFGFYQYRKRQQSAE